MGTGRLLVRLLWLLVASTPAAQAWDDYDLSGFSLAENRRLHVTAEDGVRLAAWLLVPESPGDGRLPAVLIPQDWLGTPQEFLVPAVQLVQRGHVVLLYQARGSGHSAGRYDLSGPDSQRDLRSVYHWLRAHPRVDRQRLGILAASAAATTALLASDGLPGLKAVAALSPWMDLGGALYRDGVGNPAWLELFEPESGLRRPRTDLIAQLRRGVVGAGADAWLQARSPAADRPAAGVPLLISGEMADALQDSSDLLAYAAEYPASRQVMLFHGGHGAAVLPGLSRSDGPLLTDALDWLMHWLSGVDPSQMTAHLIYETDLEGRQEQLLGWPAGGPAMMPLYLGPREAAGNGTLEPAPPELKRGISNRLQGVQDALAGMQALNFADGRRELAQWLPAVDRKHAIQFESRGLARALPLRGAPELTLWASTGSRQLQLVAYLFESNELGLGRLIAKGAIARDGLMPGEPVQLQIRLRNTARDIQAGAHLVLVLDTTDPQYLLPAQRNFSLNLLFSAGHRSVLQVPYDATLQLLQQDATAP